ncbi:MAG: recombinase family protein [Peptococcaceae bacterium]|jgi:site-specific DNA recombinase|nr:recombinase family protein [Peptococcaceae bacterium]
MRQAAVYARVSSERQKEEQTIASQVEAMLTYAQQNDYVVPGDWVFLDEGYSGATLLRPALDRLRDLAARGALEAVLVYSPDRLSRKYAYQVLLLEEFSRCGTEVTFINAPAGSGPEHELLLQFKGMIAEYEKAQIIERTRRGKLYKARMGSVNVLSGAPYGYRYVRRTEDMAAYYEVRPGESEIVRSIYKWYVQEWLSIGEIARRLTQQATPTRTGKTHWDRSVVWAILRNPAYKGTACFRKTGLIETKPRVTRRVRLQGLTIPRRKATRERPPEGRIEIPVPAIVTPKNMPSLRNGS